MSFRYFTEEEIAACRRIAHPIGTVWKDARAEEVDCNRHMHLLSAVARKAEALMSAMERLEGTP